MAKFIHLTAVGYFKLSGRARAREISVVLRTDFIDGFTYHRVHSDDFNLEDINNKTGEGTKIILNEQGVSFFEKHFFDLKMYNGYIGSNSFLVTDELNDIKKRLV